MDTIAATSESGKHNRDINAIRVYVNGFLRKSLPTITAAITPASLADGQQPDSQAVERNTFRVFFKRVYANCNCVVWKCTASCRNDTTKVTSFCRNPGVSVGHLSNCVPECRIHKSLPQGAGSTANKDALRLPASTTPSRGISIDAGAC